MTFPKIFVQLAGGLGNQMFQYACARSLSLRYGPELVVDDWSGFVRDKEYQRHYELGVFPIKARLIRRLERVPFLVRRLREKAFPREKIFLETSWYGHFVTETEQRFLRRLQSEPITRNTWINGCWQSPRYFEGFADIIRAELMPPPAREAHIIDLAKQIRNIDSVALGLRVYEESKNPNSHLRDGKPKSTAEIKKTLRRLLENRPNARIFAFCSHRTSIFDELELPQDTVFVTGDDGFEDPLKTLWLLTQCRHHVFTASSFYWWGAWLSEGIWGREAQTVFAADNFSNPDAPCAYWQKF